MSTFFLEGLALAGNGAATAQRIAANEVEQQDPKMCAGATQVW